MNFLCSPCRLTLIPGGYTEVIQDGHRMKRGVYEQGRKICKPPPVFSNAVEDHQDNLRLGARSVIRFGSR
jgi:hypothetical protein